MARKKTLIDRIPFVDRRSSSGPQRFIKDATGQVRAFAGNVLGGGDSRKAAGRKSAATRKGNAAKRSASARRGAATRAKSR